MFSVQFGIFFPDLVGDLQLMFFFSYEMSHKYSHLIVFGVGLIPEHHADTKVYRCA